MSYLQAVIDSRRLWASSLGASRPLMEVTEWLEELVALRAWAAEAVPALWLAVDHVGPVEAAETRAKLLSVIAASPVVP